MKSSTAWIYSIALLLGTSAATPPAAHKAGNIAGVWQGTLQIPGDPHRRVLKIGHGRSGWTAVIYSIDESDVPIQVKSVKLHGLDLTMTIDMNTTDWPDFHRSYKGKVSPDGTSITGVWQSFNGPFPLDFQRVQKKSAWPIPPIPREQFITVQKGVRLSVLDWGGSGRPLVLLSGLGNSGHIFYGFVSKLTPKYHVYSITRRGFGDSSKPDPSNAANYSADRLGDDVLAVLDALRLAKPVLAGHSIAGEELSSIGSRYPKRIAGLIYLDAGFSYAFYDRSRGDMIVDSNDVRRQLALLGTAIAPKEQMGLVEDLRTSLPQLEKDIPNYQKELEAALALPGPPRPPFSPIEVAIIHGEQKYTDIPVPALAIFAVPHKLGPMAPTDPTALAAAQAKELSESTADANAFERGVPSARVVRLAHADHYVFMSNPADVVREMEAFIDGLAQP